MLLSNEAPNPKHKNRALLQDAVVNAGKAVRVLPFADAKARFMEEDVLAN